MYRYVLFDGDVDALWVENMNSVMDDNKLLTLANGERMRLQKHCALLFEVSKYRRIFFRFAGIAHLLDAGNAFGEIFLYLFVPYYINHWKRYAYFSFISSICVSL